MNNRIIELFKQKKERVLNVYFTAGYPEIEDTRTIVKALSKNGVDLIEIGMPYSDPIADGPTIQKSNDVALGNGMTIATLFEQLEGVRDEIDTPIILMGYVNPVMQYGMEAFCKKAQEVGVDGLILPDLPIHEYVEEYKPLFDRYNLSNVFLVTPNTSEARLKMIDDATEGFIYVVSTSSTTGNEAASLDAQTGYFEKIKASGLQNPTLIGFNIKDNKSFDFACQYANGAIIGSAFIKALSEKGTLEEKVSNFITSVKGVPA
jgi:tryptophan synthase alpha chain